MNSKNKFRLTLIFSVLLLIASISLITTGIVIHVNETSYLNNEYKIVSLDNSYKIENNITYKYYSSKSYGKIIIKVQGTRSEDVNKITFRDQYGKITPSSVSTASTYVSYTFVLNEYGTYYITFSTINYSESSKFTISKLS